MGGQNLLLWLLLFLLLGVYFASKLLFVKITSLSEYQILNQVVLYIVLFFLFRRAFSLEDKLKKLEGTKFWKIVVFLSDHTLEIYCVQYVIIDAVREWGLIFPINWVILTAMILLAATALRWVSQKLISLVEI